MNITIAKHGRFEGVLPPWIVYVGRTHTAGRVYDRALHALANPFPVTPSVTREDVVRRYRKWLWQKMSTGDSDVVQALDTLTRVHDEYGKLVLVCHCIDTSDVSGNYCHTQVLARYLEYATAIGREE